MSPRRLMELLIVFGFFLALGVSWMGVLPLWQGPDEPAHFAYVQYMATHEGPPTEKVVAPGRAALIFSPSPAENVAIAVTERNRVLTHPAAWLSVTPGEALRAFREVGAASVAPGGDRAGSQNYVGIYPPLYYAVIGRVEAALHVRSVFDQAFGARLLSAGLLGITGVLMDLVVGLVLRRARPRAALTAAVGLLFPTLGMLGGTVTNDLMADAASLAVFYLAAGAVAGRVRTAAAVWFGVVAGLVIWTKEEAYVGLAVSVPFVLRRVWQQGPVRSAARWTAVAAGTAVVIGGPWLIFTWHAYHGLVPPLTYQGVGTEPRSALWVLGQQLFNGVFIQNVLVTQTVFGVNFPWWLPWPHHQGVFTVIGWILAAWLVAGMAAARRVPGVWLAVAWMAAGVGVIAALQIQYTLATGNSFLQGRYFFFLLGPFVWLAAHAVQRVARVAIPLALLGAAVLSGAVVNATLARYYHANIGTYLAGRVVAFGPPSVLALGPVALSVVGLGALVLAMGAVTSRAS